MLGSNWKGKAGAVVGMLGAGSVLLAGVSCALQHLTAGDVSGAMECWKQVAGGGAAFGLAFAAFGIRDAMGPSAKAPATPAQ